jgi:hypothetical protein
MGMWKRSGKRTGTNHNIGGEKKYQGGAETKSEESEEETQNPVRAGMWKRQVEDEKSDETAEKRVEETALARELERGMTGGASNFV